MLKSDTHSIKKYNFCTVVEYTKIHKIILLDSAKLNRSTHLTIINMHSNFIFLKFSQKYKILALISRLSLIFNCSSSSTCYDVFRQ